MLWLYRFIMGCLYVEFSGDIAETILNVAAKKGISLWNVKRKKNKINSYISLSDFLRLPKMIRGKGVRVHILEKRGLPFFVNRYKKRYGIAVGIVVFFAILKLLSLFIWTIEVEGNKAIPKSQIIKACNEIGIYEGVAKSKIDTGIHRQKLLLKLESLTWASLNIEGSKLTVNVSEFEEKVDKEKTLTNLKASADGVIKKIDITSGIAVVKVGDRVEKGDLLVSGVVENPNSTRFVHASGKIVAQTERSYSLSAENIQNKYIKTGKKYDKNVLEIFGLKIPFYLGIENRKYKSSLKIKQAKLFGNNLPIRLYTRSFEILTEKKIAFTDEQLKEQLVVLLENEIKQQNITNYNIVAKEFNKADNKLNLEAKITATENIAYEEILLISIGNQ